MEVDTIPRPALLKPLLLSPEELPGETETPSPPCQGARFAAVQQGAEELLEHKKQLQLGAAGEADLSHFSK